jgi:hypothetical protein
VHTPYGCSNLPSRAGIYSLLSGYGVLTFTLPKVKDKSQGILTGSWSPAVFSTSPSALSGEGISEYANVIASIQGL